MSFELNFLVHGVYSIMTTVNTANLSSFFTTVRSYCLDYNRNQTLTRQFLYLGMKIAVLLRFYMHFLIDISNILSQKLMPTVTKNTNFL